MATQVDISERGPQDMRRRRHGRELYAERQDRSMGTACYIVSSHAFVSAKAVNVRYRRNTARITTGNPTANGNKGAHLRMGLITNMCIYLWPNSAPI